MAMLEVKDLEVCYGVIRAVKGVSFSVEKGEVIALIGANGAGKTTILHTITGLIPAKSGSVVFEGKERRHGDGTCPGRQARFSTAERAGKPASRRIYTKG